MDRPQYTSIQMDELRRIGAEVQSSKSIEELRSLFERLQSLRRTFIDDFDLQIAIGQVQQSIVDRGRVLLDTTDSRRDASRTSIPHQNSQRRAEAEELPPTEVREEPPPLPPHIESIDARSWKRAVYIGAFFAILLFAGFFYLIQTARRLNIDNMAKPAATPAPSNNAPQKPKPEGTETHPAPAPANPTLRLYTDLVPGTVSVDNENPRDLHDGELQLDDLKPGRHSLKLSGRNGSASFDFDVSEKDAPKLSGPPVGDNAMVVTISTQNGKGVLSANSAGSVALVDNNVAGTISGEGLELNNLGETDHDLQIKRQNDAQRFVLTHANSPALTVFVKSDLNAGSLVVVTGEDGADISIDDQKYRRKTEKGQLRIPTLKVGSHNIKVAKQGFLDLPPQSVDIKKGEEARLVFHLQPQPQIASLQLQGAQPGIQMFIDGSLAATVANDGSAAVDGIKAGAHTIELRQEGFRPRQLEKSFKAGEAMQLSGSDIALEKIPPPAPVAAPQPPPETPAVEETAPPPQTVPAAIHKGGGFIVYPAPKAPGRYGFSMELRKGGGFLKSKRLQWFVGYQDTKNYVLLQIDGKRFVVRQVIDGKSEELKKENFETSLDNYLQVEMSVKPGSVSTRLRSEDGSWREMGTASAAGSDLTQGKFGILISGNDEVAVSSIRFTR